MCGSTSAVLQNRLLWSTHGWVHTTSCRQRVWGIVKLTLRLPQTHLSSDLQIGRKTIVHVFLMFPDSAIIRCAHHTQTAQTLPASRCSNKREMHTRITASIVHVVQVTLIWNCLEQMEPTEKLYHAPPKGLRCERSKIGMAPGEKMYHTFHPVRRHMQSGLHPRIGVRQLAHSQSPW